MQNIFCEILRERRVLGYKRMLQKGKICDTIKTGGDEYEKIYNFNFVS